MFLKIVSQPLAESHQVSFDLFPENMELSQPQLPAAVRLSNKVQEHSGC